MKKTKRILTGTLLVMALGMLTACGSNNNKADESGTVTEDKKEDNTKTDNTETDTRNDGENKSNADTNSGADDTAIDNGDTVSEETEENSGTVTDDSSESQENNIDNMKDKKITTERYPVHWEMESKILETVLAMQWKMLEMLSRMQ